MKVIKPGKVIKMIIDYPGRNYFLAYIKRRHNWVSKTLPGPPVSDFKRIIPENV